MARLLTTGFELNSATAGVEFSAVSGSPTISSTTYRSGAYAGRISSLSSGTAQYFGHDLVQTVLKTLFVRFYLRVATLPSAENRIFVLNDASGLATPVAYLTLDNSGLLALYDEDGQVGSDSSALSTGVWYRIEVKVDISAASGSHIVEAKINGTAFATASNRTIAGTPLQFLYFGGNLNSEAQTTGDWFFDDVAVNSEKSIFGLPDVIISSTGGSGANTVYAIRWKAPESGTVSGMTMYASGNGGTRNAKGLIFDESRRLLTNGVGGSVSVTSGVTAFYTSTFATPPTVEAGKTYWIGFVADGNILYSQQTKSNNVFSLQASNSYATPANITTYTEETTPRLFYATYTPTVGTALHTSYPGSGKVVVAVPSAAGDSAATTGVYSYINEIPPSDTATSGSTMIELDVNPTIAEYQVTDSGTLGIPENALINCVSVLARLREETAGTTNYYLRLKSVSGGFTHVSPLFDCGDATTVRTNPNGTTAFGNPFTITQDPSTGVPFTPTGTYSIDNMQVGVGTTDGSPDTWVLGLYAMIEYQCRPTIALNTADETDFATDTTPTLEFTGTDPEGEDVRYQVRIEDGTAYSNGFKYRKAVTQNISQVSGSADFTNIDVHFATLDPDLRTVANGGKVEHASGYDIRFETSGGTKLDHDVITWSATTGLLKVNMRVPTLTYASGTALYMYYGKTGLSATESNETGTYNSAYKGVWHLKEDPSGSAPQCLDSTSNNYDMTSGGTMTSADLVAGPVHSAVEFDGTDDYLTNTSWASVIDENDAFTISHWFSISSLPNSQMVAWGEAGASNLCSTGVFGSNIGFLGYSNDHLVSGYPFDENEWHKMSVTHNGTTVKVIIDGRELLSESMTLGTNASQDLFFGRWKDGGYFPCKLAEVRISDVARSTDWEITQYNSERNPAAFWTIGAEEAAGEQVAALSGTDSGFANTVTGGDTDPFNSGEKASFTVQAGDALATGTYYWLARASDPGGTNNYSGWAALREFYIDTGGGGSSIKSIVGVPQASIKSMQTVTIASIKSVAGVNN